MRAMLADVLEDQLVLNRALPRTLGSLLFRPGHLTNEYVRGRIVSYIAPFRLYLVSSVLFFLLFSFVGFAALEQATRIDGVPLDSALAGEQLRSAMATQERVLAEMDTMSMTPEARAAVRSSLASLETSLATIDTTMFADSARMAEMSRRVREGTPLPPGVMQPWARELKIESSTPVLQKAMDRKLAEVGHLPPRDALRQVLEDYVEFAPHMVFLLLPVFAFLLKLLYIRRNRYYAEHFVFALHVHAFTFVLFIIMLAVPWDWINPVLLCWMIAYVWIAMWKVYGQGIVRTTLKWWVLGWSYFWVFTFGMVGLAIVTLLIS